MQKRFGFLITLLMLGIFSISLITITNLTNAQTAPITSSTDRLPIGTVHAWLKSFPNVTTLPDGWVEANGQLIADSGSPFNGQTIPDLNGANESVQRFLRGSTNSGSTGGSEMHSHGTPQITPGGDGQGGLNRYLQPATNEESTLPSYYEVVWIIKIKEKTQQTPGEMTLENVNQIAQTFTSDTINVSMLSLNDTTGIDSIIYEAWGFVGNTSQEAMWSIKIKDCLGNTLQTVPVSNVPGSSLGPALDWNTPFYLSFYDDNPSTCSYSLELDEIDDGAQATVKMAKLTKISN